MPKTPEEKRAYMIAYRETNREAIRLQRAKHRATRLEETRLYNARYAATHTEETRRRKAIYHAEHREERSAKAKAWYAKHREELLGTKTEYYAAYYAAHREQLIANMVAWQRANPEKVREKTQRRRARKLAVPINDLTAEQWEEIQAAYNFRCVYCPSTCWRCRKKTHKLTQDHITPFAQGGNHTVANVVPACKSCNCKKGARAILCPVQPLLLTLS